ncbi:heavy-metal-associated domain-containing protein [Flavobacterium adhaerens]|uniref:heavy-metal-associated domain-containing protein n=1 Tax=Flavobacterium adhaerens TaxID=3149043 RepID=UPI0032B54940
MKHILYTLLFGLLTFSVSAQSKKNQKAVIKTVLNCDHCKICETCGKNFQKSLYKIKGVKMYELDEKNMTITVYYNAEKTDLQTIKTTISKLGYDADDIKADSQAYEKLDDCCKKA